MVCTILGNTADQVTSGVLYIHPALTEAVEQALLDRYQSAACAARPQHVVSGHLGLLFLSLT